MLKDFVGRWQELQIINRLWRSTQAELIVLYGRRRVGKTRLLTHWMQENEGSGLYWMAEPTSPVDQLRSFSQALFSYGSPNDETPLDFTFANWEQAFRYVTNLTSDRRMVLFIDEITYLMDINPNIVGTLQKVWDHRLKKTNLFLALSGSRMGLMQEQLLDYQSPLYGRATTTLNLSPLPFGVTNQYFPNYSAADRVAIYTIWGGIPAYWERLDPNVPVMDNLYVQLGPSNAWMIDEPRLLLQDFLKDPYYYAGIMRAMAHGARTLSEIGKRNGLSSTHITSYLKVLRDTGFVDRKVPVTQRMIRSRLGHYLVTDPYLRFYYRFLAAHQSKLALGRQDQVIRYIDDNLPDFIRENIWPEICREWLLYASINEEVPLPIEEVGGEWKRSFNIDVLGINEEAKSVILGCCYWGDEPAELQEIERLFELTDSVISKSEEWSVYYLGFAKPGWSEEAQKQAEAQIKRKLARQTRVKWHCAGVRLLSLEEVDQDLARWANI